MCGRVALAPRSTSGLRGQRLSRWEFEVAVDEGIRVAIRLPQGECGSPVSTVVLGDGKRRHTMAEGEMLEEYAPRFRLEYQSAFPSKTYTHVGYLAGATSSKSTQDWPRSSRTARPKITIHPA